MVKDGHQVIVTLQVTLEDVTVISSEHSQFF